VTIPVLFLFKGAGETTVKTAEVQTGGGLQGAGLAASQISSLFSLFYKTLQETSNACWERISSSSERKLT
jgi:peptide deformylase